MVLSGTVTNIGYMLFNDQLATSEAALISAVNTLKANPTPITDLVIDIRYNGGGLLSHPGRHAYPIPGLRPPPHQPIHLEQVLGKQPPPQSVARPPHPPTPGHTHTQ